MFAPAAGEDASCLQPVTTFPAQPQRCGDFALAFAPDDSRVAIHHDRASLTMIDLGDGHVIQTRHMPSESVTWVVWSGDVLLLLWPYEFTTVDVASLDTLCHEARTDEPALGLAFGLGLEYEPPFAVTAGPHGVARPVRLDPRSCAFSPREATGSERLIQRINLDDWYDWRTTPDRRHMLVVTQDHRFQTWRLADGARVGSWVIDDDPHLVRDPATGRPLIRRTGMDLSHATVSPRGGYLALRRASDDVGCQFEIFRLASCK